MKQTLYLHLVRLGILCLPMYSVSAQAWKNISAQIDSLYYLGHYKQAYELSKIGEQQAEREFGETHANYGCSLSVKGQMLMELGDYVQAELLMKRGVEIIENSATPNSEFYSFSVAVLGSLYQVVHNIPEAIKTIKKSLKISGKQHGKTSKEYGEALALLSTTHWSGGFYEEATAEMKAVLKIREPLYGKNHPSYAEAASNLGTMYTDTDNFIEAEPLLEVALRIRESAFGKNNIFYWYSLNHLIALRSSMGDYDQAITLGKDLLQRMAKDTLQTELYNGTVMQLIGAFFQTKRFKQADSLCTILLPTVRNAKNQLRHSDVLHALALIREQNSQWVESEKFYREAIERCKQSIGIANDQYMSRATDLARLCIKTGQYAKADSLYAALLLLSEQVQGRSSVRYGTLLSRQLSSHQVQHRTDKSLRLLAEAVQLNEAILVRQLPYWTAHQRESYVAKFIPAHQSNLSVTADLHTHAGVPDMLYQQSLFLKSLLLTQQRGTFRTIISSNNPVWVAAYDSIRSIRNQIAAQYTLPIDQRRNLDSLEACAETVEKALTRQSASFGEAQRALQVQWQDVRDALKPTEAAVEFVSFPYHNGRQLTDSVRYVALVLRSYDIAPQVVSLLTDEAPLRRLLALHKRASDADTLYATRGSTFDIDQLAQGDSLYRLIWQPIDRLLSDAKTVFLAPSGLLHQVAFAALRYGTHDATKQPQYLAERYQLRQIGSTRQVATPTLADAFYQSIKSVRAYGGIQYDSLPGLPIRSGRWPFLPGTQQEVVQIKHFVGVSATSVTGASATEADLKDVSGKSPTVLHLATHGFVFPDPTLTRPDSAVSKGRVSFRKLANPLLRTGLLMAGANRAWQEGRSVPGEEDGILTAYEVANLNLSNTQLVVLSACETALGDIRGGEGVFGLQRAFKMAGAKNLLMSLWPVPDGPTSAFMTAFYRNWKQPDTTLHQAFSRTQQQFRKRYPPAVWAAFVLIE